MKGKINYYRITSTLSHISSTTIARGPIISLFTLLLHGGATYFTVPWVRPKQTMHRLFMNVGYELSEQQLRPYFANFGAVTDVYLPKHVSGRNKGYGFLTYATESALLSVVQQPKHAIDGKVVQVMRVCTPVSFFVNCSFVFSSSSRLAWEPACDLTAHLRMLSRWTLLVPVQSERQSPVRHPAQIVTVPLAEVTVCMLED